MKNTLKSLSALLSYPSEDLQGATWEVREALVSDGVLPVAILRDLEVLLRRLETAELMELQGDYIDTFDRGRSLSLHLFEHVHGEGRERGQAMIDLGQQYLDHGFIMTDGELPDFLPLFLEFLAFLPPEEARDWLGQPAHVFTAIEERLKGKESPYAPLFRALLVIPKAKPDHEALEELRRRMAEDDSKTIDELWEEAPVTFGTSAWDAGGPTGVIAKIRAALRDGRKNHERVH